MLSGQALVLYLPQHFVFGSPKCFRCDWWSSGPTTQTVDVMYEQTRCKIQHRDSVSHEKQKYNEWRDLTKCKANRDDGKMQKPGAKVHKNQAKSRLAHWFYHALISKVVWILHCIYKSLINNIYKAFCQMKTKIIQFQFGPRLSLEISQSNLARLLALRFCDWENAL